MGRILPLWWLPLLWLLIPVSECAYVGTYPCPDTDTSNFEFNNVAVEVGYNERDKYITYKLHTFALENITDVNTTTNMYTTLHVTVEYIDHVIVDQYLRLCDFLTYDNATFIPNVPLNSQEPSTFTDIDVLRESSDLAPVTATSGGVGLAPELSTSTSSTTSLTFTPGIVPTTTTTGLSAQPTISAATVAQLRRRDNSGTQATDNTGICPITAGDHILLTYWTDVGEPGTFGSYVARFSFISADFEHTILSCSKFYATPKQPDSLIIGVAILVVTIGVFIWVVNIIVMIFSPYQESSNAFLFIASTICNAPILTRMSPSFTDYLRYIHYVFFLGALNLTYPGFYQPILSSFRWSTLMDMNNGIAIPTQGHVYYAYTGNGLRGLMTSDSDNLATQEYKNFLKCFGILIVVVLFISEINVVINLIRNRKTRSPTTTKAFMMNNFHYMLGTVVRLFLQVFAIPFLVLTFYLFSAISSPDVLFDSSDQKAPRTWSIIVSCILLSVWLLLAIFFGYRYVCSKKNHRKLYSSLKIILIWGQFYNLYETGKVFFVLIDTAEIFLFSVLVGAVQRNGAAQIVCIVVLELVYLFALVKISPYYSGARMNPWKFVISTTKTLVAVLALPYIPSLNVSLRARSNLAYAQMIMHLAVFLFLFILPTCYNLYAVAKEWMRARQGLAVWPPPGGLGANEVIVPMSPDDVSFRPSDSASFSIPEVDGSFSPYGNNRGPRHASSNMSLGLCVPSSPAPLDFGFGSSPDDVRLSHTQHDSEATSIASGVLELTDKRVLPGISVNHSFFPPSHPVHRKKPVDYTTREADFFYNSYRILEPDPEVKRLWEAREERLKPKGAAGGHIDEKEHFLATSDKHNRSKWTLSRFPFRSALVGKKQEEPEEKGFHVMRPRQLVVKESNTEKGSLSRNSLSFLSSKDDVTEKSPPPLPQSSTAESDTESFVSFDTAGNGK